METKFSDDIKESISLSREEAIRLNNDFISTEHLMLGIIRSANNSAIDALKRKGIFIDKVKYDIEKYISENYESKNNESGATPFTKQCEKVIKITYLEIKIYNSNIIRCVHLLSSILRDKESATTKILNKYELDYESLSSIIRDYSIGYFPKTEASVSKDDEAQIIRILDSYLIQISDQFEPAIGINDIASEMARLISNLKVTERGKMIGIFGNWGRGKTFLMNLIWNELSKIDSKYNRVDFHAWKYQDTPAIWAYLYEALAEGYYKSNHDNWFLKKLERILRIIKLNFFRNGIYGPCIFVATCIFTYFIGHELFSSKPFLFSEGGKDFKGLKIAGFIIPLTVGFVTWVQNAVKNSHSSAISLFKQYYENKTYSPLLGVQFEIQKEIKYLLKAWFSGKNKSDKVFLIVDDIDRCNEDKVMQIIDSLRIMLEDDELAKKVIILSAIDERILKLSVRKKYFEFIDKDFKLKNKLDESDAVSNQMITEYLDKLFISGIKLGKLSSSDKKELFTLFAKEQLLSKKEKVNLLPEQDVVINATYQKEFIGYAEKLTTLLKNGVANADEITVNIDGRIHSINVNDSAKKHKPMLQADEHLFIRNTIGSFNVEMTPRQIRIFYFRYLLARNLLYKKHSTFSSQEELQAVRSLLSSILIANCFDYDNTSEKERLRISVSDKENETVNIFNLSYTLQKDVILNVFNVCEMVIGY